MTSILPIVQDCVGLHDPTHQGYSHLAFIPAGAGIVLISGQYGAGTSPAVVSAHFPQQMRQSFDNLRTAILSVGATPRNVAKLTILIVDHSEEKLPLLGEQLARLFGEYRPAMTLVPVPKLAMDSMLFEVEAMLVLPAA